MVPKEIQNLAATWKQTGQENIDKQLEAAGNFINIKLENNLVF